MDKPSTERHLRSWQRRKQARPGEILDAALAVFAEKGFAAARMEDIAAKAGVTKGTIYLYFTSKEEVFKSLARKHVSENLLLAAEQAKTFDGAAFEFLNVFYSAFFYIMLQSQAIVLPKIIIGESGNFPELARFWRVEVVEKVFGVLSSVVQKGIDRGEIRDLPVEYIVKLCVAPLVMCMIWHTTFAPTTDVPFDYQAFLATHRDVLIKGLSPEGKTP